MTRMRRPFVLLLAGLAASAAAAPAGQRNVREVPAPFRGGWDENPANCAGPEPRFSITATSVWNFEARYRVRRVRLLGPTRIEVVTRHDDQAGGPAGDEVTFAFTLVDGGRAIQGDGANFRRCDRPVNRE